ncbi:MAG: L-2-hydroxyglutarate oxidase [Rhodothermia bacterium]|nr:MAG: L-2-hydroxyglutarate oxidase [Rhodothermia bacterium]
MKVDVAIIGGGILGCATAFRLIGRPSVDRLVILEKEPSLALHQTGRNSGVIHSGIYYQPGSQKAENCRIGREQLIEFCEKENVPFEICGKVIVATSENELPRLKAILDRGNRNGINCSPIEVERLRELEPNANGLAAIHVPDAGIIDFSAVCNRLAKCCTERGFEIRTDTRVVRMTRRPDSTIVHTSSGDIEADVVVNCAGLHSDRVAQMSGATPDIKIIPFRGIFYELRPQARYLCNNLIYPVPDPSYSFLGIHFTRTMDGRVECGPNAVMATGREGYSFASGSLKDSLEYLGFPGFRRMSLKHWKKGIMEIVRTASKRAYLGEARRLIPTLTANDVIPCRSGIRAQAVSLAGDLVDDFVIIESRAVINVCNAPSPAATAALRIGQVISERVLERLS